MRIKTDWDYSDAATRRALKEIVVPKLKASLAELNLCKELCDQNPVWAESWAEAGMLADALHLSNSIRIIELKIYFAERRRNQRGNS